MTPLSRRSHVVEAPEWLSSLASSAKARLALGQAGSGMPTSAQLRFALDHARARDAVYETLEEGRLAADLGAMDLPAEIVRSRALDRELYLRRPDLGRRLARDDAHRIAENSVKPELVIVVADGLSAQAANINAISVIEQFRSEIGFRFSLKVFLASLARVALGDDICVAAGGRCVLVLLGERPGLSSAHSLGAYLTYAPYAGISDAQRNCISNIRKDGLSAEKAARRLAWLVNEAFSRQLTGTQLKEESSFGLPSPLDAF